MSRAGRRARKADLQRLKKPAEAAFAASIRRCCPSSFLEAHLAECRRDPVECGTKIGYTDKPAAVRVALKVSPTYGRVSPYRCSSCRLWHVGHKPGSGPRPDRTDQAAAS